MKLTTRPHTFGCTFGGEFSHLFAVREGIPIDEAMNVAAAMLDAALETIRGAACDLDNAGADAKTLWSGIYALEVATALVSSAAGTLDLNAELSDPAEDGAS